MTSRSGHEGVPLKGLWEIEDESARRFVFRFHKTRLSGLNWPEALLAAQWDFRNELSRVLASLSNYGPID